MYFVRSANSPLLVRMEGFPLPASKNLLQVFQFGVKQAPTVFLNRILPTKAAASLIGRELA